MKKWKDIERQWYKTAMSTGKKKKDNKNVLKMSLNKKNNKNLKCHQFID